MGLKKWINLIFSPANCMAEGEAAYQVGTRASYDE